MANQNGIAITIKGFLPTGTTLEEQFAAMSLVRAAQGDFSQLADLALEMTEVTFDAQIKTRREPKPEGGAE